MLDIGAIILQFCLVPLGGPPIYQSVLSDILMPIFQEFDAAYVATRSTSYAPSLRWLDLEYCDKINDTHLAEIVAVCRGTLKVRDYYGEDVEPAWITCRKGSVFLAKAMS